jgi:hypothetical protein
MLYICNQPHQFPYEYLYSSYQIDSPHNSKHLFDIYTLTHVFWLIVLASLGKMINNSYILPIIFVSSVFFEMYENDHRQIIKYNRIETDSYGYSSYRGDSAMNVVGDIIGNIVGIYIGMFFSGKAVIIILVALFAVITQVVGLSYWTDLPQFFVA